MSTHEPSATTGTGTPRHVEVHVTFDDRDEAAAIADRLVADRLAACVHVHPITSTYRWEGRVCHDEEWLLVAKTSAARTSAIVGLVAASHSYDLPAITWQPLGGTPEYLAWIDAEVSAP